MNYELAKELQEAGFTQEHRNGVMMDWNQSGKPFEEKEFVYSPTLSELIEACNTEEEKGKRFRWLKYNKENGWMAQGRPDHTLNARFPKDPRGYGHTPEEAVARLWLALNRT